VGHLLTKIACSNCHALEPGAPLRSLPDKFFGSTDADMIAAFLRGPLKHGAIPYMPRIDLPEDEIRAIAAYIASVNGARTHAQPGHLVAKE
jgi:mono/diheme cytochrome c family protein